MVSKNYLIFIFGPDPSIGHCAIIQSWILWAILSNSKIVLIDKTHLKKIA